MDEIDKYRGHDMQSGYDPETAATQWFSPAYHTNQAKLTAHADEPRCSSKAAARATSSTTRTATRKASSSRAAPPAWFANAAAAGSRPGWRASARRLQQTTQSPARYNWQASVSYVTGSHNIKVGVQ